MKYVNTKGWARHRTFGLRVEWMNLFLGFPDDWWTLGRLGSKQVVSLNEWLRTLGLRKRNCYDLALLEAWRTLGSESLELWSLSWANIAYSWPTARLYVLRNYTTPVTTTDMLSDFMGYVGNVAERTIYDGILELFGLLNHTPIGRSLGQGIISPGRPRSLFRAGNPAPPTVGLFQSLVNLFGGQEGDSIKLNQDQLWPWVVFGCDRDYVISQIITNKCDWIEITSDEIVCRDIDKGASHVMDLLGLHRAS